MRLAVSGSSRGGTGARSVEALLAHQARFHTSNHRVRVNLALGFCGCRGFVLLAVATAGRSSSSSSHCGSARRSLVLMLSNRRDVSI